VSSTVVLVEEANPALGPDGIERVSKATPMPGYAEFEAGAGCWTPTRPSRGRGSYASAVPR
jgi:hypothetical protein